MYHLFLGLLLLGSSIFARANTEQDESMQNYEVVLELMAKEFNIPLTTKAGGMAIETMISIGKTIQALNKQQQEGLPHFAVWANAVLRDVKKDLEPQGVTFTNHEFKNLYHDLLREVVIKAKQKEASQEWIIRWSDRVVKMIMTVLKQAETDEFWRDCDQVSWIHTKKFHKIGSVQALFEQLSGSQIIILPIVRKTGASGIATMNQLATAGVFTIPITTNKILDVPGAGHETITNAFAMLRHDIFHLTRYLQHQSTVLKVPSQIADSMQHKILDLLIFMEWHEGAGLERYLDGIYDDQKSGNSCSHTCVLLKKNLSELAFCDEALKAYIKDLSCEDCLKFLELLLMENDAEML